MSPRVLITGVSGFVGQYLLKYRPWEAQVTGAVHRENAWQSSPFYGRFPVIPLDLSQPVSDQLKDVHADVVIHAAAMAGLGACQQQPEKAQRINAEATAELARWCAQHNARLVYVSTDIVFGGRAAPYSEDNAPNPINVYGKSKFGGEQAVAQMHPDAAIVRLALVLGRGLGRSRNFVDWFLERMQAGEKIPVFIDEIRTPVSVHGAAQKLWEIALSEERGVFHLAGGEAINRWELCKSFCNQLGRGQDLLRPVSQADLADYPRPADVSLVSTRKLNGRPVQLPPVREILNEILGTRR